MTTTTTTTTTTTISSASASASSILNIIEQCRNTNSSIEKLKILEQNKNNNLLKLVCFYTLNPLHNFGLKQIPEYIPDPKGPKIIMTESLLQHELQQFIDRKLTGNKAINHLKYLLTNINEHEILKLIFERNLKAGINKKLINKCWNNLINDWPNMNSQPLNDKSIKHITWPAYIQEKIDGTRTYILLKPNNNIQIYTRLGKLINLHHIPELLKSNQMNQYIYNNFTSIMPEYENGIILDGELLYYTPENNTPLERKLSNGKVNKAIRGTLTNKEDEHFKFIAWDLIPADTFFGKTPDDNTNYKTRYIYLKNLIENNNHILNNKIIIINNYTTENMKHTLEIFDKLTSLGKEGIILKNINSQWENKRSYNSLKLKIENTCELRVTKWNKGTGKYKNLLGSLTCESEDKKIITNIGTGFSDEDRRNITEQNSLDKIITVKYNELISNYKKNEYSLFLPVFMEFRHDKDIPDDISQIK